MSELILDGHKLNWHFDRVQEWEAGDRIAPISVDMALTRACGSMCKFCYAMVQEPQSRSVIREQHAMNLADDFAEIGVRGVSLISDGESTLSKAYIPFVNGLKDRGIDVGNATNGWVLPSETLEQVLPSLTWVRFTVAAGTPSRYADIMYKGPSETQVFDHAMRNIRKAVEIKNKLGLPVTLGIQMVLMPGLADEIIPFSQLALDLGVDYGVIKHCSDDETGSLGIDYSFYETTYDLLNEAEAMSNDRTSIIVKWNKIKAGPQSMFSKFYGPQFLLQISGSGLVAPSGMFFNAKYSKFHIGNFVDQRFRDIFKSKLYWRVMDYLVSDHFDAKTMMGSLPIQHYVNNALNEHLRGNRIIDKRHQAPPAHINFL
jgi:MoaA/NifB/PqqE/SkfB family radical SAM enzyme